MTWDKDYEIRMRLNKYRMLRIQERSMVKRMEEIQIQLLDNDEELAMLENPAVTQETFKEFQIARINNKFKYV